MRLRQLGAELMLLPLGAMAAVTGRSVVPLLLAAAGIVPLRRWRFRRKSALEARRRSGAVIDLCVGLAAELRSGAAPEQALYAMTSRPGPLLAGLGAEQVVRLAAGRYGADIQAAFVRLAELPGGRGAAAVAACWRVTTNSGGGLAAGLDQVADGLRAERDLAEEIAGELAAARSTIAMLAALPAVGLVLGSVLGAKPVHVLLHTSTGLGCLAGGTAFEAAGLLWTARIVRAAQDPAAGRWRASRSEAERDGARCVAHAGCGICRTRSGNEFPQREVGLGVAW